MEMEFPDDLVPSLLQKLHLPELRCALLVCKQWKTLVLSELLNLKLTSYFHMNGRWTSAEIKAFINSRCSKLPGKRFTDPKSKLFLHEFSVGRITDPRSTAYLHMKTLCYVAFVYWEPRHYRWIMVLSCDIWTAPFISKLPNIPGEHGFTRRLEIALWVDDKNYKVMVFFATPCYVAVYDSKKDQWGRADQDLGNAAFMSPVVKGNLCYVLDGEGRNLFLYDFKTGTFLKHVITLKSSPRSASMWGLLRTSILALYHGELLLLQKVDNHKRLEMFLVETKRSVIKLEPLGEVVVPEVCPIVGLTEYVVKIISSKEVDNKLYIHITCHGTKSCSGIPDSIILEWSRGVTTWFASRKGSLRSFACLEAEIFTDNLW